MTDVPTVSEDSGAPNVTDAGKALIREFLDYSGTYYFPQPLVADVIPVDQTVLNTFRKDGVLWGNGWEKNGRVKYTASGVLAAGLMVEYSWHFKPTVAAELVSREINFIHALRDDRDLSFLNVVKLARRWPRHPNMRGTLQTTSIKDYGSSYLTRRSVAIFPIGLLMAGWAIRAMMKMQASDED